MSWFLAFVGFALLVILHELGHFTAAKAVGMRVERFSLFFPPLLARKKIGETEYAIGSVPLGGYVKISGMNPDENLPDEVRTRAYYSQPVWKRIVVIAAGPAVNLLVAIVLLFVFFTLIGPQTTTRNVGDGRARLPGRRQDPAGRPAGGGGRARRHPDGAVQADRLAQVRRRSHHQGLQGHRAGDGDRGPRRRAQDAHPHPDLRPRGRSARAWASATRRARATRCRSPRARTRPLDAFWFITRETVKLPARLLDSQDRKEISGVVGSYEVTRQTIVSDLADTVWILAIISLSLAIVNLFPFLPLDGGHIFWAIVEKVRRKPVPFSVMERAGVVGFMLVILLFLVGLSNDIDRLSGEGFRVR